MTLQEALEVSMEGPFSVGYATAYFHSIIDGHTQIVISTEMDEGSAVTRSGMGSWHVIMLSPTATDNLKWAPLVDAQEIANVRWAYEHPASARIIFQ